MKSSCDELENFLPDVAWEIQVWNRVSNYLDKYGILEKISSSTRECKKSSADRYGGW